MKATRKQKLKQRAEKNEKADVWKRESLRRLLNVMGLNGVFADLPEIIYNMFLQLYCPGLEVVAADDSRDDPEIQAAIRDIKRLVRRPSALPHKGMVVDLCLDDIIRGYFTVVTGVQRFTSRIGRPMPMSRRVRELMEEAWEIIEDPEENWVPDLNAMLNRELYDIRDFSFRVDGRMIGMRFVEALKREGRYYDKVVLRMHQAQPHVLPVDGSTRKAYPCSRPWAAEGIRQTTWNCKGLTIESRREELPVFIDKHAIARLQERVPLRGYESLLHKVMVDCLSYPVLTPREPGKYLVEARLGARRVGYFVAQVLPDLVLIRTFLFLTMQGTPEADLLRQKLGLSRNDVERYKLDRFWTLTSSDLADDPLLCRVLAECGCGHLSHFNLPEVRFKWLESHGSRMKEFFGIREANGGFMVGQKWMRWSNTSGENVCSL